MEKKSRVERRVAPPLKWHEPVSRDLPGRTQVTGLVPAANDGEKGDTSQFCLQEPRPLYPPCVAPSLETAFSQLQWDLQDGMSGA